MSSLLQQHIPEGIEQNVCFAIQNTDFKRDGKSKQLYNHYKLHTVL